MFFFFEAIFGASYLTSGPLEKYASEYVAQLAPIRADAVEANRPISVDAVPQDAAGPLESRRKM